MRLTPEEEASACHKIKLMRAALEHSRQKLQLYREAHSGEYVGGVEYTQLIAEIDEALAPAKPPPS